jgi:hypothetical protein
LADLVGLYVRVPLPPTITVKFCWAETATARTRVAATVEERIFKLLIRSFESV